MFGTEFLGKMSVTPKANRVKSILDVLPADFRANPITSRYPNKSSSNPIEFEAALFRSSPLWDDCPLQGAPRCPSASRRYRTADGTCNNARNPRRGASLLPMQRFLPPSYNDGECICISNTIYRDRKRERD